MGRKYQKQQEFTTKPTKKCICKKKGGGGELSLVSGYYHEPVEQVVMVIAPIT